MTPKQLAEHHGIRFVAGAVDCDEPALLTFIERLLKEKAQCPHCGQTTSAPTTQSSTSS